jgi:hypothetical protein
MLHLLAKILCPFSYHFEKYTRGYLTSTVIFFWHRAFPFSPEFIRLTVYPKRTPVHVRSLLSGVGYTDRSTGKSHAGKLPLDKVMTTL